ncbi:MAG: inorganic phosphate transporter [Chloroflexi bacterium]|nr:inorganic phosphate transporter [Chloroflexota bacterium]MBU1662201.1 inorganic phosphate transporter [Chloroflexota bacterium]
MIYLYVLIAASMIFDFLNGFHDSSNIVATVIASRALPPRMALYMTAVAHFVAPFLFGVAVANTVGKGLIDPSAITTSVVIAAVLSAILWNLITWLIGIPSSSSHALLGGLLGSAIIAEGVGVIHLDGLLKILLALFISPPLGLLVGFLFMHLVMFLSRGATPKINNLFKRLQIFTSLGLALSHGSNDAQKTMGIITMGLVTAGVQDSFHVPIWVIAICAGAIALGTAFGGWSLIKTLGGRIYKIRPVDAFASQAASAAVILGAALVGGPVSTTQVVSSAIMGVGAAERVNKVRWLVGQEMLVTWVLTIPTTAIVSALIYWLLQSIV